MHNVFPKEVINHRESDVFRHFRDHAFMWQTVVQFDSLKLQHYDTARAASTAKPR